VDVSKTSDILIEQSTTGGVVRPVFGPPDFILQHMPRSKKDPKPFVRWTSHPDGRFRYSGAEVYVDKGDNAS